MTATAEAAALCPFSVGDRVHAPGTPGQTDTAYRRGGPGTVVKVQMLPRRALTRDGDIVETTEIFCWVALHDPTTPERPQPYRPDELRHLPTV